jgi:hypothetical protein
MHTIPQILRTAGIRYQDYSRAPNQGVFLTMACQLLGSYRSLTRFRIGRSEYAGWHAHHIVQKSDLARLGIASQFPVYEEQICVLIPRMGHEDRINRILNDQSPHGLIVNALELRGAYRHAYEMLGNYCGGGEMPIREELMKIVSAVFRSAGV